MRLLASLTVAAALASTAFLAPASAYEKTVRIPIVHCEITVYTSDVSVSVSRDQISVSYARWGDTGSRTNC